jgi:hypothetical protein
MRLAIALLTASLTIPVAVAAASSVAPETVGGAPGCTDLNSEWTELAPEQATVTRNDDGSFDWNSGQNVAAVVAGADGESNVYRYELGSAGDAGLSAPAGRPASDIRFCIEQARQQVLGARYESARARLMSPRGCRGRTFRTAVVGSGISRVVFTLDGNRVADMHRPHRGGLWSIRLNPRRYRQGLHRLQVRVDFKPSTRTTARRLSSTFRRC